MNRTTTEAELRAELEQARKQIADLEAAGRAKAKKQLTSATQRALMPESADALLSTTEAYLMGLLGSTPDAMIIVDTDGKILMANEQAETMFGYSQHELIGASVEILLSEHLRGAHRENRAKYLAQPRFLTSGIDREINARRKNGEEFPAEISLSHHKNANGESVVLGAVRDITERRRAERLVEAQRDLARLISAGLPTEEALATCLETVLRIAGLDSGGVYLFDEHSRALELVFHTGLTPTFVAAATRFSEETPNAQMVLTGKTIYFAEADMRAIAYYTNEGLRSGVIVPIQRHGEILGCLNLASHTLTSIPDHARHAIEAVSVEIANTITHYRTEASLRASREQLGRALVAAHMAVWHYHIATRRMTWSPEAARIFGVDVLDDNFDTLLARFHPDDRPRVLNALQRALAQGVLSNLEYRIFDADGNMHWLINHGHVEYDPHGVPVAFSGIVQDITATREMQAALEAESVRRRILFEESPDGILIINPDTAGFVEFNTTAHMQLGYSREEFARLHIFDVEAQETTDETLAHIAEIARAGKADFETLQRTKQGELRNVHVIAQVVEILGQPVYYCTWRDITERKRAEAARRESDERYHLLFEAMAQGVVFQDAEGHIIQANPAAEKILGLTFDQLRGRTSADPRWHAVHEDGSDFPGDTHPAMVALRTGQIVNNVVMGVFNPATESYRWINVSAVPRFVGDAEKPYQVFTTFEDITERKLAEQALLEKLKLQEQLEKTASIAPGMLHIFKRDAAGGYSMPYVSSAIEDIYGLRPADVQVNMAAVFSRVDASDTSLIQTTIQESERTMTPWRAEYRYHHPHKGLRWLAGHSTPVREADGSLLWYGLIEDITERKQAEAQLRESEQKYRDLLNGMNDTVWVIDFDAKILDVNNAATAALGYTREELLAMTVYDLDADLRPEQIQTLIDKLPGDKIQIFETEHTRKDGTKIPVEISSSLASYMGRTVIMSIARDITARKREERYTEASLRLANLSYQSPDIDSFLRAVLDEAETLTDSQTSFFHFVDDDQSTITLQAWSTNTLDAMFAAEGKNEHYPVTQAGVWADCIRHDQPLIYNDYASLPNRRGLPDGHAPVLRLITVPIKRNDLIAAVIGVGNKPQDYNEDDLLTIGRLAEDAFDIILRKRAELQLRESEERFRTVANYTYDMEYWLDVDQQFLYLSPACKRVTGYSREEFLQTPSLLHTMIHPDDREAYRRHLKQEFNSLEPISVDFRIITADGEERWINHTCQDVTGDDGQRRGRRASNRDITGRKQSEVQIRQQMEDLALINMLNDAANRGEDLEKIIQLLSEEFRRVFHCDNSSVYLLSADQQMLELRSNALSASTRQKIETLIGRPIPNVKIRIGAGSYFTEVINSERGLVTSDPQTLQRWMMEFTETAFLPKVVRPTVKALIPQIFRLLKIRSAITIPLKSADRVLGAVEISSSNPLSEQDLDRLQNVRTSLSEILRRKLIEQELMKSEEKYRGLMESLDNAVSTVDSGGTFMYMNDKAAEKLGGTPQALIGSNIATLFPAPFAARQLAAIQDVFATDSESIFEAQSMGKDGLRWYRFSLQPLHDERGGVSQVLINATDIHDLKTVQQELQELNRTLEERVRERTAEVQDLYENAPTGYHSLNADGKVIAINQTELRWLGYAREEVIGRHFDEFITEQSARLFQTVFRALKRNGKVSDIEFEMRRKDGSTFPIMLNAIAIYDENGHYVSSRSTMVDITRRKLAEKELQRNVNFTAALLNAIPTPVFYKDRDGRYLGCNRAFTEFTGKTAKQIRGETGRQLWPREHVERSERMDIELMQRQDRQVHETTVTDKQGNTRPVIFVKDVFFDESGNVAGLVGAFVDISEHKRAEETLRLANVELARAMRMKDEFLANMSHELRTPLNGVLGLSEALQMQTYGALNERQLRALKSIEHSGRHLLSLINDILDLSKIEAGKLEIHLEAVSMMDICQSSLSFVNQPALKKGISLHFLADDSVTTVLADARRLKQILVNLLSNAVKFTPNNGQVTLQVQANAEQGMAELSVIDTGIGIAPEDLPRLFAPFVQVDSSLTRQFEGTGLGLALVKELTELHGGAVRVTSTVGQGSTFTVSIPWLPNPTVPETQDDDETAQPLLEAPSQPQSLQTILLAEDKDLNAAAIGEFLESQGYRIIYAVSGYEAIEKARQYTPDLILMDVQMPELDGLEATRRLRADPRFATVPIIALTALAMTGDRERCLAAGATNYVSKPISLRELADLIQDILAGKV